MACMIVLVGQWSCSGESVGRSEKFGIASTRKSRRSFGANSGQPGHWVASVQAAAAISLWANFAETAIAEYKPKGANALP